MTDFLEPINHFANIFNTVYLIIYFGIGVFAAFRFQNLLFSLILIGFITFLSLSFAQIVPSILINLKSYIGAMGMGFAVGYGIKWLFFKLNGFN